MKKERAKHRFIYVLVVFVVVMYIGNFSIVTDEYTIENSAFPESFDGLKVVQISDMHGAEFGYLNKRLMKRVAKCDPDIIAVTGDIIESMRGDNEKDRAYVESLITSLCDIAPVYYVTGNHEWATGWSYDLIDLVKRSGATALRNEYVVMSNGEEEFVIAGVHDPNGPYDMITPAELVGEIRENEGDKFILMLAHRNDQLSQWAELGVDAVLCGHAHGGVIRIPFVGGLISTDRTFFPEYTDGIYSEGGTDMLVSRGLGNGIGMIRVFNRPQLVELTLTSGK